MPLHVISCHRLNWQIPGYRHDFEKQDFLDLAEILTNLKGRFIMPINDTPEIREILKSFTNEEATSNTPSPNRPKPEKRSTPDY